MPLVGPSFTPLMGIVGGGFYFHNMSLQMFGKAQNPKKNTQNLALGFFLVFATYTIVGITGVYGFTGSRFASQSPPVSEIKENCLNMMSSDDTLATFIRFCIFCQLLCVNALLFGMLRQQIYDLKDGLKKKKEFVEGRQSQNNS